MKVLITGAAGMLGHDVAAAADAVHHEVAALTREELDITDEYAVKAAFDRELPQAVVNCAAFTDVDAAETDEDTAHLINATGAGIVAAAAAAVGAKVVYPSTDYVFDGLKGELYDEADAPNPRSAYGRTKLAGEIATAEANPRNMIVRSSWLFGMHGPNFVETMLSLAERQSEVLVVRDQVGCPTYTAQLAHAIVDLLDYETLGLMHIAGGEYCSWYDFAREIFRQSQLEMVVLSGTSDMLDRPAPRPAFSALATRREDVPLLPRWDHGLHAYLAERVAQVGLPDETGPSTAADWNTP
ncbi:MAG: dTDP-4-dehydrorhamnose reductase [Solirubrobacterales bacterium]